MISIIGLKNAGKTTFLVAPAAELARRKFRVMTIKHGSHPADMDQQGCTRAWPPSRSSNPTRRLVRADATT
jgi:molybdopterin-guanine dinucleotide biosynthesis protein MobB